jgi:hypothetical protein
VSLIILFVVSFPLPDPFPELLQADSTKKQAAVKNNLFVILKKFIAKGNFIC